MPFVNFGTYSRFQKMKIYKKDCPLCQRDRKRKHKHSDDSVVDHRAVHVRVSPRSVRFKFLDGSGIIIRRDNPAFVEAVGEWFLNEVDALPEGYDG
jgi:hypothetical protein